MGKSASSLDASDLLDWPHTLCGVIESEPLRGIFRTPIFINLS